MKDDEESSTPKELDASLRSVRFTLRVKVFQPASLNMTTQKIPLYLSRFVGPKGLSRSGEYAQADERGTPSS